MDNSATARSFEVLNPLGHLVIAFADATRARIAKLALTTLAPGSDAVHHYSDREMLDRIDEGLAGAGRLPCLGQEVNLARQDRDLAALGYHWLVVRAASDGHALRLAAFAKACGAVRAQYYGRCVHDELIAPAVQDDPSDFLLSGAWPALNLPAPTGLPTPLPAHWSLIAGTVRGCRRPVSFHWRTRVE